MTEINPVKDQRAYIPEMDRAKRDEIRNLMKRGTFKVILKEDGTSYLTPMDYQVDLFSLSNLIKMGKSNTKQDL